MSVAIAIRFPAGRFHATPWSSHVNEGTPEWPPSPWRILRALVSVWKKTCGDDEDVAERMSSVFGKLLEPPVYALPLTAGGHTRHYMPLYAGGDKRSKVFDAFVALARDEELVVLWRKAELTAEERAALGAVVGRLSYLGRAESLCEARLVDAAEVGGRLNCGPREGAVLRPGDEEVRVLCPDPATALGNEHVPAHEKKSGRGKSRVVERIPLFDPDWHLTMETKTLHDKGWSAPPGARWVGYVRPEMDRPAPPRPVHRRVATGLGVARFAVDGAVLPLISETLPICEQLRAACMGRYRRIEESRIYGGATPEGKPRPRSEVFAGKDEHGRPLKGHRHARFLAMDEDGDGRIDTLIVTARDGFGPSELAALDQLRTLNRGEDRDSLNLVLLALEKLDLAAGALFGPAKLWQSVTPFLATRFAKRNGKKRDAPELLGQENIQQFAQHVLMEELDRLRQRRPELLMPKVTPLAENRVGVQRLRPLQFKRYRWRRSDDGGRRAAGAFLLEFPEPVRGPIALGHSSHFGMGLFVPVNP